MTKEGTYPGKAGSGAGHFMTQKGSESMKTRHTTTFIQDESQVPVGYVGMSGFVVNSTDYKAVSRAQKTGLIRAVKLVRHVGDLKGGAVWVHKADADEYLRSLSGLDDEDSQAAPQSTVVDSHQCATAAAAASLASIDTTLGEIYRVLERLATAVESIVTQPNAAHRQLIGTMSSNGFHD